MMILIVPGLMILLALACLAGLGADSRDPDISLFREPRDGPQLVPRRMRPRY